MATGLGQVAGRELLVALDSALDSLFGAGLQGASDADQLALLQTSLRVDARLHAWQAQLAARIESSDATWHEHGTSATTWLAETAHLTPHEARRLVQGGLDLNQHPIVAAAASTGSLLPGQVEAINGVLSTLPPDLPADAAAQAQTTMVSFAATHNATELRRLSRNLLDLVCPAVAEDREAARLEREHLAALRTRHLRFIHDNRGSVLIHGSLPVTDAEPFMRIIDSYAAAQKRALDAVDPRAEFVTPGMRRADALLAMVNVHSRSAIAPAHGGDRPRIVVTLSYDNLRKAAANTGIGTDRTTGSPDPSRGSDPTQPPAGHLAGHLLGSGEPVPASVLRRWLCDADILPVVLGGDSEILDIGRIQRLVSPAIRTALEVRDGGCLFPGCDQPPQACHAHHIQPWWAGGRTALNNLVLVCPHHHNTVEPSRDPTADRWKVRLRGDGVAEVIPPSRVDPRQQPRIHARLLTRMRT